MGVWRRVFPAAVAWMGLTGGSCATAPDDVPVTGGRTYRMGFSGFPPKPDLGAAIASLTMWTTRADVAVFHVEVPWRLLLTGGDLTAHLNAEYTGLAAFYRSKGLPIYVTFDVTDGLAREKEARELRELGRSITEPVVQRRFRDFVGAWVTAIRPEFVGLGAETNLVRLAAPRAVYDALRTLTAATAPDVRAILPTATLYTTVQAEVAWGRLPLTNRYVGITEDLRDFAWAQAIGVSSYPYLGGFATPDDIPLDYLSRLRGAGVMPLFVSEGGWSSAAVTGVTSSPALQAAYVRRMSQVLQAASATAWLQLNFTDLDTAAFPVPAGYEEILSLFVRIGLVDSELRPKPSLAAWDSVFATPK